MQLIENEDMNKLFKWISSFRRYNLPFSFIIDNYFGNSIQQVATENDYDYKLIPLKSMSPDKITKSLDNIDKKSIVHFDITDGFLDSKNWDIPEEEKDLSNDSILKNALNWQKIKKVYDFFLENRTNNNLIVCITSSDIITKHMDTYILNRIGCALNFKQYETEI